MADTRPTALSLFSGVGGLDIAVDLVTGARTLAYVEREASAAAVLMARMEDQALECAPVWCGDIADFDTGPFVGAVDWLVGGFPCQDLSVAGKRAGIDGPKSGLWREVVRIAGDIRPRYVFVENVPGLLADGPMRRVLGDLSALGFDVQWGSVRASAVGAPHRRERVFVLARNMAHDHDHGREGERCGGVLDGQRAARGHDADRCNENVADTAGAQGRREGARRSEGRRGDAGGTGGAMGHAARQRRAQGRAEPARQQGRHDAAEHGGALADACGTELQGQLAGLGDAQGRQEPDGPAALRGRTGLFPPGPADADAWRRVIAEQPWLAPALDKQTAESLVRGLADGLAPLVAGHRADALRAAGNGVVPLCAAVALAVLLGRGVVNRDEAIARAEGEK